MSDDSTSDEFSAEAIEASLPPPRDADPPNLRRDIADELADHLACALARESASPDPAAGVRRRFGDPHALAARLYIDAIKGTVLMQKLTLGLSAASLLLVGVAVWQSMQAVTAVRTSAERSAAAYEGLTEKLDELTTQVRAAQPSDAFVDVSLRVESEDGRPLPGYRVVIRKPDDPLVVRGTSRDDGLAIKRRLGGGTYLLSAAHDFGWTTNENVFLIEPGIEQSLVLVAPDPERTATLAFTNELDPSDISPEVFFDDERGQAPEDVDFPSAERVAVVFNVNGNTTTKALDSAIRWSWTYSGKSSRSDQLVATNDLSKVGLVSQSLRAKQRPEMAFTFQSPGRSILVMPLMARVIPEELPLITEIQVPAADLVVYAVNVLAKFELPTATGSNRQPADDDWVALSSGDGFPRRQSSERLRDKRPIFQSTLSPDVGSRETVVVRLRPLAAVRSENLAAAR